MPNPNKRRGLFAGAVTGLALLTTAGAQAQEYYMAQIIGVGENFCPRGSMEAAGQLLAISTHSALFSLMGCQYGGDCRTTFGLPDLRGRSPIGEGHGPGLPLYEQGQMGGRTETTMLVSEMPSHSHALEASGNPPTEMSPSGHALPTYTDPSAEIYSTQPPTTAEMANIIGMTGGTQPFNVIQPTSTIRYCVVTEGLFPPRN